MRQRSLSLLILAFLCAIFLMATANAQERKGMISGHVTDSTRAVLQGARVELQPNGPSAVSDNEGQFTLTGVMPGHYTLTVSYLGFAPFSKDVTVTAGQALNVDAALQVEKRSEIVEVRPEREVGEVGAINRE